MGEPFTKSQDIAKPPGLPPGPVGEVRLWVGGKKAQTGSKASSPSPWWRRMLMAWLAGTGLLAGVVLLAFSFRWGLMLIFDPQALPQIQSWLAAPLTPQPAASSMTRTELQQAVAAAGQELGAPIQISGQGEEDDWLIFPVLAGDGERIVKLRLLQQASPSQLVDVASIAVPPMPAAKVLAPFTPKERQAKVVPPSFSAQQLTLLPVPPEPSPYRWLTLQGRWSSQGSHLYYGQIVIFDPQRRRLDLSAHWSSPAQQRPQWVDLDGEAPTDLVIDETTAMEPTLRGLRVVQQWGMGPALQLQPVSWVGVPVDSSAEAYRYQQALRLARNGLWREAYLRLQGLKKSLADQWNPTAEAQLRLMARHRTMTQRQADQEWSQPTQKIMALLIDGQWTPALELLEQSPQHLEPLMRRLAADQGRLWNRISAAVSLPEPAPAAFVWGGLALEAKQNRQAAQQWLERQPVDDLTRNRLTAIWESLDHSAVALATAAKDSSLPEQGNDALEPRPVGAQLPPVQGIIGSVTPLQLPLADDWYVPADQGASLVQGERWYAVEVPIVRRDRAWQQRWLPSQASVAPDLLWASLPFATAPSVTMVRWESSTLGVSQNLYIKGLRVQNGTVTLLAAGTQSPNPSFAPIAFSNGALVWLSAQQQATVSDQAVVTPILNEIMRHQGPLPEPVGTYALGAMLQEVQMHTLDLTGDGRLEQVLTFDGAALDQLQGLGIKVDRTAHKTIILTDRQQMLYSDLFQPLTLIALTNPSDGFPLSLVTHRAGGYELLQWSPTGETFIGSP